MAGQAQTSPRLVKGFIIMLAVLAGAYLYWTFYLNPSLREINRAHAEEEKLTGEIEAMNRKLAQKDAVEQEWRELQDDAEQLMLLIPPLQTVPQVLGNLEQMLAETPVELQSLRAGEIRAHAGYATITIEMAVSGEAGSVITLLSNMENFLHRLVVEQVTWARQEGDVRLSLRFSIVLVP